MSIVDRRDPATIDLSARLTTSLTLKRPIVSANMDTVTRAEMAIVHGGGGRLGIIDRGFRPGDIEPQVREVMKVKRTQHGVIPDPLTIAPEATLADARAVMERARVGTLRRDSRRLASRGAAHRTRPAVCRTTVGDGGQPHDAAEPSGDLHRTGHRGRGGGGHGAHGEEAAAGRLVGPADRAG